MKHTEEMYRRPCGCRSAGECSCNDFAWYVALANAVNGFTGELVNRYGDTLCFHPPRAPRDTLLLDIVSQLDELEVGYRAFRIWHRSHEGSDVKAFGAAMLSKLNRKFHEDGKTGWDDPSWPREDILRQLTEHAAKGDMVDVANFAMFAWNQK